MCAALCYVGATFIKIDIPVGTERTMFHFGNVFCVLAALLIGGKRIIIEFCDFRKGNRSQGLTIIESAII